MHPVFFGIKRVHLRTLALSRALLHGHELTPARFDMMRIVRLHHYGAPQSKIQYLLGVSAPTVSRMLKSLEELGFVARSRMVEDARQQLVELTELGLERIDDALAALIDRGVADRFALRGLGLDRRVARPLLRKLQGFLSTIRRNYFDPSPFASPWRIDVIAPYACTTLVDGRLTAGTA